MKLTFIEKSILAISIFAIIGIANANATIFYIDPYLGNDTSDGLSTGTAWKTIASGATAARVAPGDDIRVKKTPDPTLVGNVTATFMNGTLTLAEAHTVTLSNCETAWTGSASVTSSRSSTGAREGTYISSNSIGSAFTTGKVSYFALPATLDLTNYQQLSLWFQGSASWVANTFQIRLCSDATGDTPVSTITLPASSYATGLWQKFTVDTTASLGSGINSISLYAASDPGAISVYMDNIFAAKASSAADSITLDSVVSANPTAGYSFEYPWYAIRSIDETIIRLDNTSESLLSANQAYSAWWTDSGTFPLYKRECFPMTSQSNTVKESGSASLPTKYSGGWNFTSGLQDGMTFFDGSKQTIGVPYDAMYAPTLTNIFVENFGFMRCGGMYLQGAGKSYIKNIYMASWYIGGAYNAIGVGGYLDGVTVVNGGTSSAALDTYSIVGGENVFLAGSTTDLNNITSTEQVTRSLNIFKNTRFYNLNGTGTPALQNNTHAGIFYGSFGFLSRYIGTVYKSTTQAHKGTTSWAFTPVATSYGVHTLNYPLGQVINTAGKQVTITAWIYKTDATGNIARLSIDSYLDASIVTTAADSSGWQQVTLTYTPLKSGVSTIYGSVEYVSSVNPVYFDDISISVEGNPSYDLTDLDYSSQGVVLNTNLKGLSSSYAWSS